MSATHDLMAKDGMKMVKKSELGIEEFSHADCKDIGDPAGISIAEGEFLYGLVRCIKPERILETGTNIGTSAQFMALGLLHNNKGHLDTIEHDHTVFTRADSKIKKMGLSKYVTIHNMRVEDFPVTGLYDMMWLDSELAIRYGELVRFYHNVRYGGIIGMHDIWQLDFSEFGGVPPEIRNWIRHGNLRALTIDSGHGMTIFQKHRADDYLAEIQGGRA